MNIKYLYILVSVISVVFLTLTAFTGKQSLDDEIVTNKDLINFSHSFHSDLAECADCHSAVSESISLNDRLLPDHDDCSNCHEVDDDEECSTCHANEIYEPLIQNKIGIDIQS